MLSEKEVFILEAVADKDMPVQCEETDEPGTIAETGGIKIPRGALVKEIRNNKMHKLIYDVGPYRVIEWLCMSEPEEGMVAVSVHHDDVQ